MKRIGMFLISAGLLPLFFLAGCSQMGQTDQKQDRIPSRQEEDPLITENDMEKK